MSASVMTGFLKTLGVGAMIRGIWALLGIGVVVGVFATASLGYFLFADERRAI